jgi:hypothetical protein
MRIGSMHAFRRRERRGISGSTIADFCSGRFGGQPTILSWVTVAATPTPESTPQRLAAIRAQMSLLADYL